MEALKKRATTKLVVKITFRFHRSRHNLGLVRFQSLRAPVSRDDLHPRVCLIFSFALSHQKAVYYQHI